ncbi:MAG TPA: hypothetical protein P5050_03045 [Bacteroidia bacterium]|nr:hypothetical protein [Bacteroidia bacterium]HRS58175.1 hypothetical protein [Bacteroidia bacterium]HRU67505.1 hypothetical protein [Bacteroidia bacterium]
MNRHKLIKLNLSIGILLLTLFSAIPHVLKAQKDTILPDTKYLNINPLNYPTNLRTFDDTTLNRFHLFDPLKSFDDFYTSTAGTGSPYFSNKHRLSENSLHFPAANVPGLFLTFPENISFFNTKTPFTYLHYVQGGKNLQQLNVLHSRNINPLLNFAIAYNLMGFNGFYYHQKVQNSNFHISSNFRTPDEHYMLFAAYSADKYIQNCNGGISYEDFRLLNWQRRLVAPVATESASQKNFRKTLFIFHQLNINPKDSAKKGNLYLGHRFSWTKNAYQYLEENPLNAYYPFIFYDSTATNDSIHWQNIENRVFLSKYGSQSETPIFQAGFIHLASITHLRQLDSNLNAFLAFLHGNIISGKFILKYDADYVLSGQNKNNFHIDIQPLLILSDRYALFLKSAISRKAVPFYLQYATLNHLSWENHFLPFSESSISLGISNLKNTDYIDFQFINLKNYVYVNTDLSAIQSPASISLAVLSMLKKLRIGHFHFDNHAVIQYSSDVAAYPLPSWMLNNLTYFKFNLFKNNLSLEAGIDCRLTASWNAPFYYAPMNIFYVQDSISVPFYPYGAVFINGKVKRGRFFLLFEQPHQYLFKENSTFVIPNYPMTPFNFRFGISWSFYD